MAHQSFLLGGIAAEFLTILFIKASFGAVVVGTDLEPIRRKI